MKTMTDRPRTAVICFTARGLQTALRIREILPESHVWVKMREAGPSHGAELVEGSLSGWTQARFADSRLIIFVGATGIAVRSIAPFLMSKQRDPAVLCVDETAAFVIPLVSGHIGGANREAARLADGLHAVPVITTATDLNGKFAVDVFAERNGLSISDLSLAKRISAAVLEGKRIPVISEFPVDGNAPEELELRLLSEAGRDDECGRVDENGQSAPEATVPRIRIGIRAAERSGELRLVPGIVTIGLGCRRGKDEKEMLSFIEDVLARENIDPLSVVQIATIDVKKDEPAMKAAAARFGAALKVFDAVSLSACPGTFAHSDFVKKTVGVDNVCERSALLGALTEAGHAGETSGAGSGHPAHLIVRKTAADGMTMAAAVRDWRGHFE